MALGSLAAGEGDELGLQVSVQLAWLHVRRGPRTQGGFQAFFDEPLPNAHHGTETRVERFAHGIVGPGGTALGLVSLQQDPRMGQDPSGGFAFREHGGELFSLLVGERDTILLGYGEHLHTQGITSATPPSREESLSP